MQSAQTRNLDKYSFVLHGAAPDSQLYRFFLCLAGVVRYAERTRTHGVRPEWMGVAPYAIRVTKHVSVLDARSAPRRGEDRP